MESSKVLEDISSILEQFNPKESIMKDDSEKVLKEIEKLHKQFDESYKELLQLSAPLNEYKSGIIKVLPSNSEDLL